MEKTDKIIVGVLVAGAIAAVVYFATRPQPVSNVPLGDTPIPTREQANSGAPTLADAGDFITQLTTNGLRVARTVMDENRIAQDRAREQAAREQAQRPATGAFRTGGGVSDALGARK